MFGTKSTNKQRTINIINPSSFAKSYLDYLNGKTMIAEISNKDFFIPQFDTESLLDYTFPDGFPKCCTWHENIYSKALDKFNEFPNCCNLHKNLVSQPWFNKSDYIDLPRKIVSTISYTIHCINKCVENPTWYKEITDYLQYTIHSYGQFPEGFGPPIGVSQYTSCIEAFIIESKDIIPSKKKKLLKFFDIQNEIRIGKKTPDIQELIETYREWLVVFPFEISYLSHLKPKLQSMLPILAGPVDTNIYSGLSSSKLASKNDVIQFIKDLTSLIIKESNAAEAIRKGLIKNNAHTEIEILNAKHRVEINEITFSGSKNEKTYLRMLSKWLKSEKKYLHNLVKLTSENFSNEAFNLNIIDGIKLLQSGDTNEDCINTIRNKGANKEAKVRNWFKTFLSARYKGSIVTAEEENGNGRMDLKIYHDKMGTKVMEFKGWWNYDKKNSVRQIVNYLTDFEGEGYIFMINHLSTKDISEPYRKLFEKTETGYRTDTWEEYKIENSQISYFSSKHKFGVKEKLIYHFIFNVNF